MIRNYIISTVVIISTLIGAYYLLHYYALPQETNNTHTRQITPTIHNITTHDISPNQPVITTIYDAPNTQQIPIDNPNITVSNIQETQKTLTHNNILQEKPTKTPVKDHKNAPLKKMPSKETPKNSTKNKKNIQSQKSIIPHTDKPVNIKNLSTQSETIKNSIVSSSTKTIIIKNNITEEMLSYKHWSRKKPYVPSTFELMINDQIIEPGSDYNIEITNEPIRIGYRYVFMNDIRKDAREIPITIKPNTKILFITFSWHTPNHIILNEQ